MSIGGLSTGKLAKLYINSYEDVEQKKGGKTFAVYYNPSSFTSTYGVAYSADKPIAVESFKADGHKFSPVTYSFELMFDGTGASQPSGDPPTGKVIDGKLDVDNAIKEFLTLCYKVEGTSHRPRFLTLNWGTTMLARVVLTGVTITKDLFSSQGATLRAKLACSFREFKDEALATAEARLSSPDLTHTRIVQQGDRLPHMCELIYGSADLYLQVARFNNLGNYRNLTPGQQIHFPPLVTSKK